MAYTGKKIETKLYDTYTKAETDTLLSGIDATTLKDSSSSVVADASSGNLNLGDSVRAQFGAGNDLQIYHDGSNSYIAESGTGQLIIQGAAQIELKSSAVDERMIVAKSQNSVDLYYDNALKLATTSTGIESKSSSSTTSARINASDSENRSLFIESPNLNQVAKLGTSGTGNALAIEMNGNERMRIDSSGRVTMPYQPAFYVHSTVGNVNITNSATTVVPFSTASFNRGNHFNLSSNVFYAPVAGVYSFHYHTYEQGSNGYNRLNITLNASSVAYKITGSHGGALTTTVSALIYCNVNDAVGVTFQSDQSNDYYAAYNHSFFTGHLIG